MSYSKLLRWYPKAWREENGDVFLGMLEDDAAARGATKPGFSEAWSIRVHGLAERASYKVALFFAVLALIASSAPGVVIFTERLVTGYDFVTVSPALVISTVLAPGIGVAASGLSIVTLLLSTRHLTVGAAAIATTLFVTGAIASSTASVLVDRTGMLQLVCGASLAVALTVVLASRWGSLRVVPWRWAASAGLGILGGALWSARLSESSATIPLGIAGGIALILFIGGTRAITPGPGEQSTREVPRAVVDIPRLRRLAWAAGASGTIGGLCLALHEFNLIPSGDWGTWNLVLAAIAPAPTAIAAGAHSAARLGNVARWSAALWCLGLAVLALGFALGPASTYPQQVLGAALVALATTLPLTALWRGSSNRTAWLGLLLALCSTPFLFFAAQQIYVVMPFVCGGLAIWASSRLRGQRPASEQAPDPGNAVPV